MAKVKAVLAALVYIEIRGESRGGLRTREDDGLVLRFMNWYGDMKIWPYQGLHSGGGSWAGLFRPEDAERVKEWLKNEGVEFVSDRDNF